MMDVAISKILHKEDGLRRLSVTFSTYPSSWTGVVGPSGSGKTTLLRMIAGLETPDNGHIRFGETILYSSNDKICLPAHQRRGAFVFQEPCLFPHLNVKQNISYGCTDPHLVEHLLEIAGLEELAKRNIRSLSGGQKQRISLLRAVASRPDFLLLDEPFSGLDYAKRQFFKEIIIRLFEEFKFEVLLVSHDLDEINDLCDGIVDVEKGNVSSRERKPYAVNF